MEETNAPSPELLQPFQLIAGLGTESIAWLSEQLVPITLAPGTALTQEKMTNRELYFISKGTMDVQKTANGTAQETILSLEATTVIGEMSCLLGRAAIATVVTTSFVTGWKLDTRALRKAPPGLHLRERLLERILKLVSSRLESTNQSVLKLLEKKDGDSTLSLKEIDQFTENWKAGLSFTEDFQDLDESWSFK
ncbi:MAG: cyclic nucleotide-binding domain-containing protein [Deltaproteobacteria bacterium]|nr:cyclic nucleotide-binding domain-containing protein [Deltaproteobacteria bacterium]